MVGHRRNDVKPPRLQNGTSVGAMPYAAT